MAMSKKEERMQEYDARNDHFKRRDNPLLTKDDVMDEEDVLDEKIERMMQDDD